MLITLACFLSACVHLGDSAATDLLADFYGASIPEQQDVAIDDPVGSDMGAASLAQMLREGIAYSANGQANIIGEIDFVKHMCNIDENKIFVSGFLDEGSGAGSGRAPMIRLPGLLSFPSTGIQPSADTVRIYHNPLL